MCVCLTLEVYTRTKFVKIYSLKSNRSCWIFFSLPHDSTFNSNFFVWIEWQVLECDMYLYETSSFSSNFWSSLFTKKHRFWWILFKHKHAHTHKSSQAICKIFSSPPVPLQGIFCVCVCVHYCEFCVFHPALILFYKYTSFLCKNIHNFGESNILCVLLVRRDLTWSGLIFHFVPEVNTEKCIIIYKLSSVCVCVYTDFYYEKRKINFINSRQNRGYFCCSTNKKAVRRSKVK